MDLKSVAMGMGFALVWSSAFTAARVLVAASPPLATLTLRFLVTGALALLVGRLLGQGWRMTRAQWRATILFALCQNALYLGLNFVAMTRIDASMAAIIASAMPLLVALIGWLVLGDKPAPLGVAGLVAGMAGVAVIMSARLGGGSDPLGIALCVLGALSLAGATLAVRSVAASDNLMMVVGLQALIGAVPLGLLSVLTETWAFEVTPGSVLAFLYVSVVVGLLGTWLWFLLVGRIGAVRAAAFHFLNPFFGVLVAALVLGEGLGATDLLGVAIVTAGILAVQLSKPRGLRRQGPTGPLR